MSKSDEPIDVVIIGCGISGLSVAYHLILNDFKGRIVVLEGKTGIGGRIRSTLTKYDSHPIELGANWIHGILGNPIYELAQQHKLIDQFNTSDKHIVEARTITGHRVDIKLIEEIYKTFFYFIKKCENYFQLQNEDFIPFNNSFGQHLKADIDSYINGLNVDNESKQLRKSIFNSLLSRETSIDGCHCLDEVSLKDIGSYVELPGGNVTIPQGYIQIMNCLLSEINAKIESKENKINKTSNTDDSFTILKSHRVIKIKWKYISEINKNDNNSHIQVICDNNSIFYCKHVVVTLPLGVLKKNANNLFEPILPQYKMDSINALGFGVVDKIFLEYSLPLNDFIDVIVDETIVLWDNASTLNPKWFHKIFSISKITNHCLLLWVSGREALELEQLTDEEINEELCQILKQFFNNKKFPKADHLIVNRWGNDAFTLGSYSYIPTNASVRDIELLSQPIYADPTHEKPILVFAGEATHMTYYSTVHGAYLSGRKAATYLLDVDSNE